MKINSLRRLGAIFAVPVVAALALVLPGCSEAPSTDQAAAPTEEAPAETAPAEAASATDDAVLATVNGQPITESEVNAQFTQVLGPQGAALPPEQLQALRAQATPRIVDGLVTQALLLKAAQDAETAPSDEEINAAIEQMKSSVPEGATFEQALAQAGVSESELRENMAEEMAVAALVRKQAEGIAVPEEATVQAFYETNKEKFQKPEMVKASHILFGVDQNASDEDKAKAKAEADQVRKSLVKAKGKNFGEMATEHSSCPSKSQGGSLGTFPRGKMVEPFETAAFSQKPGEVGEIVETPFGYHIIMVEERNDSEQVPFDEVKDRITQHLQQEGQQKAVADYIDSLKEGASISYPEGSPAAPGAMPAMPTPPTAPGAAPSSS